jgi:hypothetical protein
VNYTLDTHPNVGRCLTWASDGQRVWAPITDGHYAVCIVTCSAGNHARVKSEKRDFEQWRDVRDLFEFKETIH